MNAFAEPNICDPDTLAAVPTLGNTLAAASAPFAVASRYLAAFNAIFKPINTSISSGMWCMR